MPNTGTHHHAIEVARQLLAIGLWPDPLDPFIVIHEADELRRRWQRPGPGTYHADFNVVVYPAVYDLEAGQDYEIIAISDSFWQLHDLSTIPHPIHGSTRWKN